jgi:hypothetical protein
MRRGSGSIFEKGVVLIAKKEGGGGETVVVESGDWKVSKSFISLSLFFTTSCPCLSSSVTRIKNIKLPNLEG